MEPDDSRDRQRGRLAGRVALVTGAGRGIGAQIARRLAADGAVVLAGDVDGEAALRTAAEIERDGLTARGIRMDVTRADDRARAVAEARGLGGLHILVNNAGIIAPGLPLDIDVESWRRVFSVNVEGLFFCCQAALPTMREQHYGRIVNLSSTGAKAGTPALVAYNASKSAVLAITRDLAARHGRDGITVNSVLPGIIDTAQWETINTTVGPMVGYASGEMMRERTRSIPLGRPGTPDDVAGVVAFLASDDAAYVTGQSVGACGGLVMP